MQAAELSAQRNAHPTCTRLINLQAELPFELSTFGAQIGFRLRFVSCSLHSRLID